MVFNGLFLGPGTLRDILETTPGLSDVMLPDMMMKSWKILSAAIITMCVFSFMLSYNDNFNKHVYNNSWSAEPFYYKTSKVLFPVNQINKARKVFQHLKKITAQNFCTVFLNFRQINHVRHV